MKVLQSKTFRVLTGHTLSVIGASAQSQEILSTLFPQLPEDPVAPLQPTPPVGSVSQRVGPPPRAPLPPEPSAAQSAATTTADKASSRVASGRTLAGGKNPQSAPSSAKPFSSSSQSSQSSHSSHSAHMGIASPAGSVDLTSGRGATIDAAAKAPLVQRRARPPPSLIAQDQERRKKKTKTLSYFVAVNTNGK